jgi:hypothetical protein
MPNSGINKVLLAKKKLNKSASDGKILKHSEFNTVNQPQQGGQPNCSVLFGIQEEQQPTRKS